MHNFRQESEFLLITKTSHNFNRYFLSQKRRQYTKICRKKSMEKAKRFDIALLNFDIIKIYRIFDKNFVSNHLLKANKFIFKENHIVHIYVIRFPELKFLLTFNLKVNL